MSETADLFRAMAARIEAMDEGDFAGAIVVVPPEGEAIAMLLSDPAKPMDHFWLSAKGRIESAFQEYSTRTQAAMPFGRR